MGVADTYFQNVDGIVVDNALLFSEDGNSKLLHIDLSTYAVTAFRDLSHLSGWLSGVGYKDGLYYVGQAMRILSFEDDDVVFIVKEFPEKHNVITFVVVGNTAFPVLNFAGEVQKINLSTREAETFVAGLNFPEDIELWGGH